MVIPTPIDRKLEESGVIRTMAIDLSDSADDRSVIVEVLRSRLYKDKILAPIREYSTNAVDSQVEAGVNRAISVFLPTQISPELRIRDYGTGLNPDEVEQIYTKYGKSTKRNTNAQTGQLGLGCKSAFAYGDNFLVISCKEGIKTTYNLTHKGVCSAIAAEPMDSGERNGIEVVVPVKQEDVGSFQEKALEFFKYWQSPPEIFGIDEEHRTKYVKEISNKPFISGEKWAIYHTDRYSYRQNNGVVVMGNIPYPLDWDLIHSKINLTKYGQEHCYHLFNFLKDNRVVMWFDIGELDFTASRESLEYTEKTYTGITLKVNSIIDNLVAIVSQKVGAANSYWEAKVLYGELFGVNTDSELNYNLGRLESLFRRQIKFQDKLVNSGYFEHLERWDRNLGYAGDDGENWSGRIASDPILRVYSLSENKLKESYLNDRYTTNRKIPAKNNNKIVVDDLNMPEMSKKVAKWIFNTVDPKSGPIRQVFYLAFSSQDQMNEFFDKMNFQSVPVIYLSSILTNVKLWIKEQRKKKYSGDAVSNPIPLETELYKVQVLLTNLKKYSRYFSIQDVDLRNKQGLFLKKTSEGIDFKTHVPLPMNDRMAQHLSHIFDFIGEADKTIMIIPERTVESKWFAKAFEKKQWINAIDYIKEKLVEHIKNHKKIDSQTFEYQFGHSSDDLSISFCSELLPFIKDVDGDMYKLCSSLKMDFLNHQNVIIAISALGLKNDVYSCDEGSSLNIRSLFDSVKAKYPLIFDMDYFHTYTDNKRSGFSERLLENIAGYVNAMDHFSKAS